ncbi:MAG: DUF5020 family protein, partial [Bacteroidales bacterium]|nr:DUF5020 family protein [Bacteroidales bacterium]
DFADGRQMLTSTVEMFHLDDYGSTFFFIDMDYSSEANGIDGVDLAYMELARSFQIGDLPIQPRAEFNGGFGRFVGGNYNINNCYLVGAEKTFLSEDFSKFFTLQLNYKMIADKLGANLDEPQHSFQITGVWGMNFFDNKVTFSGFADFWKEDGFSFNETNENTEYVFIAEPQLWYNINSSFSVGGELELSSNFGGYDSFKARPTLGVKWNIAPEK